MPLTNQQATAAPLTPERLAELKALHEKATPGPWFLDCEPKDRAENAQCVVSSKEDEPGTELFDTFNRGYKVSGVLEEADEDGQRWYDVAGEKDLKFVVEVYNAFPAIAAELQRLWAAERAMGRVLLCSACGGTGTLPGGTVEYPASACCHHGHAKECACVLCLWVRDGYEKDQRIAELERELAAARADGERLDWLLGEDIRKSRQFLMFFVQHLQGVHPGWTIERWRKEIDAARANGGGR